MPRSWWRCWEEPLSAAGCLARAMGRIHRPLLWFAGMQMALAGLALLTLLSLEQVRHLYAALAPGLGLEQGFIQALRFGLSVAVLSPIALLAGGSLPLLGPVGGPTEHTARQRAGRTPVRLGNSGCGCRVRLHCPNSPAHAAGRSCHLACGRPACCGWVVGPLGPSNGFD